jgi:DNA-binding response OmpR family regulator
MNKQLLLVVEDNHPLANVLHDHLTNEGFSLLEARNGRDGLALALKKHPDLIMLDILMPVMDGISMLKQLREDEWGRSAKVLVLTNLTGPIDMTEAAKLGVSEYYTKSNIKLSELTNRIKKMVK